MQKSCIEPAWSASLESISSVRLRHTQVWSRLHRAASALTSYACACDGKSLFAQTLWHKSMATIVRGVPLCSGCGVDVYFRLFPRPLETALRLAWQGQVYTTRGPDSMSDRRTRYFDLLICTPSSHSCWCPEIWRLSRFSQEALKLPFGNSSIFPIVVYKRS
jgi:hypothetical protein